MVDPKVAGCKGKLAGMVAFIFFSGMAMGGFTMILAERYWLQPRQQALEKAEEQVALEHLSTELRLDDLQTRQVEEILDQVIMEHADMMAQFRTNRLHGHDRIMKILNEDQRKRFDQVLAEIGNQQRH
jgi:hypothetical protein